MTAPPLQYHWNGQDRETERPPARFWTAIGDDNVRCDLCYRRCELAPFVDHAHLGMKGSGSPGFYEKRMRAAGAVPHVLESIHTWAAMMQQGGVTLCVSDLVSPYHWQSDEDFEKFSRFLYTWIVEEVGNLVPIWIRTISRPVPHPQRSTQYLVPKGDGKPGQRRQRRRKLRAKEIAQEAGALYTHIDRQTRHCHKCSIALVGDASPDHICKGCGTWTPVRTWPGERGIGGSNL